MAAVPDVTVAVPGAPVSDFQPGADLTFLARMHAALEAQWDAAISDFETDDAETPSMRGLRCPSARWKPGVKAFGVVDQRGEVRLLSEAVVVDDEVTKLQSEGLEPHRYYRFEAPCISGECNNWNGRECMVGRAVIEALGSERRTDDRCVLQARCRWYQSWGETVCNGCVWVVRGRPLLK